MTKHQIQQYHQTISRKCRLCLLASLGLVISLSLVKIVVSNQTVTLGRDLEAIKQETDLTQQQNLQLKSRSISSSGLVKTRRPPGSDQLSFFGRQNYQAIF